MLNIIYITSIILLYFMHPTNDNMLKGIHFGLEFWDGEDIDWFVESSETDKSLLDIIADYIGECRFSSWPEDDPSYLADDYYDND